MAGGLVAGPGVRHLSRLRASCSVLSSPRTTLASPIRSLSWWRVAELFAVFASAVVLDTVAVLVKVPLVVGTTTMLTVADELSPTVLRAQLTVAVAEEKVQLPCVMVALNLGVLREEQGDAAGPPPTSWPSTRATPIRRSWRRSTSTGC